MKLNKFVSVERRYNEIKPLVSKYHTLENDIRPLADRRRKWERIYKVNDRKYVLTDVIPTWKGVEGAPWFNRYANRAAKRPPIVWEKNKDGTETVTVRGGVLQANDNSRYQFLHNYLPVGIYFNSGSKHSFECRAETVEGDTITSQFVKRYIPRPEETWASVGSAECCVGTAGNAEPPDYYLNFRRHEDSLIGSWEFLGPVYKEPKVRVDTDKKRELKPYLEDFYNWMCMVGPVMPYDDYTYRAKIMGEIDDYLRDNYMGAWRTSFHNSFPPPLAIDVVKDYNHPLRTHLAWNFLVTSDIRGVNTEEDRVRFRAAFNRRVNTVFNLYKTVMV
jgi:hypothetical protein